MSSVLLSMLGNSFISWFKPICLGMDCFIFIIINITMCIFGFHFCDISIPNRFYMFVAFSCLLSDRLTVVFCLLITMIYVQIQHFSSISFGIPQWFYVSYQWNCCRHKCTRYFLFSFHFYSELIINNNSYALNIAFYGECKINRLRTIQYINFKMWQHIFVQRQTVDKLKTKVFVIATQIFMIIK